MSVLRQGDYAVICWTRLAVSSWSQCRTTLPSSICVATMKGTETRRPVAGIPMKGVRERDAQPRRLRAADQLSMLA